MSAAFLSLLARLSVCQNLCHVNNTLYILFLKLLKVFMHRVHNKLGHKAGKEVKRDLTIPTLTIAPAYTLFVAGNSFGICFH